MIVSVLAYMATNHEKYEYTQDTMAFLSKILSHDLSCLMYQNESGYSISDKTACVPSEDSDQPSLSV